MPFSVNDVPSVEIKGLEFLVTVVLEGLVETASTRGPKRRNQERKIMTAAWCTYVKQEGKGGGESCHVFL